MRPRVIITQRVGRLGNQINLLAHLLALHQETGICFVHPVLGDYGHYFAGSCHDPWVRIPINKSSGFPWSRTLIYYIIRGAIKLHLVPSSQVYSVDYRETINMDTTEFKEKVLKAETLFLNGGWLFQHNRVRPNFWRLAREFFSLVEPYRSNVDTCVCRARKGVDILFGVHIRQTDFKEHAGGKYYFPTETYAELMRHCVGLYPGRRVGFLVCSDELKGIEDFPGMTVNFGTGEAVEDMYSLGACDFIIGSAASSFSLWPAILFQKPMYRLSETNLFPRLEEFQITTHPWYVVN
jgi:hypothetical protein